MQIFIKPQTSVFFESIEAFASRLDVHKRYALITDDLVENHFGKTFEKSLRDKGIDISLFSFPNGEKYKTRLVKEQIEDAMQGRKLGRDSCVIALGGGVVTDLAGFVAATYCRGIPLISIPTTLMGMVDACLGGKTAVNTDHGKNLIGSLHPASLVCIDLQFLKTLPEKEWKNGYAEIIKHALIASKSFFRSLEKGKVSLQEMITWSINIKKQVLESDFQEKGERRTLNFGHTIAHALENLLQHQISHGEAVGIGLLAESFLSWKLQGLQEGEFHRIYALLQRYDMPLTIPKEISFSKLMSAMSMDKKSLKSSPRFVILKSIGASFPFDGHYCAEVPSKILQEMYDYFAS